MYRQKYLIEVVKLKKIVLFLLLIIVIGLISYLVINNDDKEKNLHLIGELKLESENTPIKKFNFSVTSAETEPSTIIFSNINDISLSLQKTEGSEDYVPPESLIYDIPKRRVGDKLTLKPNEALEYPIAVDTKKLTSGKYKLVVNFSAENVEIITHTIDIVIE